MNTVCFISIISKSINCPAHNLQIALCICGKLGYKFSPIYIFIYIQKFESAQSCPTLVL